MMKWATVAGVALVVLLIARRAGAGEWETLPGYRQGSGVIL